MSVHFTNRAFFGAYLKGRKAFEAGEPCQSPYADLRGGVNGQITTYSRSFQNFWRDGWKDAKSGKENRYAVKPKE